MFPPWWSSQIVPTQPASFNSVSGTHTFHLLLMKKIRWRFWMKIWVEPLKVIKNKQEKLSSHTKPHSLVRLLAATLLHSSHKSSQKEWISTRIRMNLHRSNQTHRRTLLLILRKRKTVYPRISILPVFPSLFTPICTTSTQATTGCRSSRSSKTLKFR